MTTPIDEAGRKRFWAKLGAVVVAVGGVVLYVTSGGKFRPKS